MTSRLLSLFMKITFFFAAVFATAQMKEERETPRSMVATRYGIVAANSPIAARAGTAMLERGGNAVDAIIAADAVLGVVEPVFGGMGGDLFALIYDAKSQRIYGMNASGWTPAGQTIEFMKKKGVTGRIAGVDAVNVPGAVAGWDQMRRRFGKLPFSVILAPAVHIADAGFPVSEQIGVVFQQPFGKVPGFADTYMPGGKAPRAGELFRNPDLAHSLTLIARQGREAFYKGAIAEAVVPFLQRLGSAMNMADLAEYDAEWQEPVSTTYRGWAVYQMPPNGSGASTLEMLNLMELYPLAEYGRNSARALHVMIEAKKLATADLLRYAGDPRSSAIPTESLISRKLAERRAALIHEGRANCTVEPANAEEIAEGISRHTTYMTAVDREGNIVSLIRSNAAGFGTGLVAPGTGFSLQNRSSGFRLEPGLPNSLAGRKRPLHTITPAFMEKEGARIAFGFAGGLTQPAAQAQFVSNIADFGMNIQQALAAPRFGKITADGCPVDIETRVGADVRAALSAWGHQLQPRGDYGGAIVGIGHAVMRRPEGLNFGAADPRWDGDAIPEMPSVLLEPVR